MSSGNYISGGQYGEKMIASLKGRVLYRDISSVVIECGGVGYEVFVTSSVMSQGLSAGDEIMLHTYMQVSENGISLFGFSSREEKKLFEKLISVSGVGPKGAVSILSALGQTGLLIAIATNDHKSISKAPGIGTKTAQKIILDLKDKVDTDQIEKSTGITVDVNEISGSAAQEALMALTSLGFKDAESRSAIASIKDKDKMDAEAILGIALKKLAR